MDILDKINKLRIARGWSMYKLAEECEITPSTIANMFARETMPSITTLTAICNGLDISLSDFFSEGIENPDKQDERELLKNYRKLTPKTKQAVKQFIKNIT